MSVEYLCSDLSPDGCSFIHHYIVWPNEGTDTSTGPTIEGTQG